MTTPMWVLMYTLFSISLTEIFSFYSEKYFNRQWCAGMKIIHALLWPLILLVVMLKIVTENDDEDDSNML